MSYYRIIQLRYIKKNHHLIYSRVWNRGIDVGQLINVGPGKFGKKNKCRALNTRLCNLENAISYFDLFNGIGGPRLCARLVMNKNGLIIPMCSSMTLRRGFKIYNF